jgi:hypothetical protein
MNRRQRLKRSLSHTGMDAFNLFSIISGAALVVASSAFYWYLLPRDGQVNPLVKNSHVGSMVTITIMCFFCIGIALLLDGLFG